MDLASISLSTILAYVKSKTQEDLHLEFKTVNGSDLSNGPDKKNFAKAISGFANSDGGLIVWGVDARAVDDVDCAQEIRPVPNIKQFESRANELTGSAVSPIVDGVEHLAIPHEGNSGFLVTKVPTSPRAPHMAKLGENRFYKRSGSSFYPMESFDIIDVLNRPHSPVLKPIMKVGKKNQHRCPGGDYTYQFTVSFGLENTGMAVAKHPYFSLMLPPHFFHNQYGIDGNCSHGLDPCPTDIERQICYGSNSGRVILPKTTCMICSIVSNHYTPDRPLQPLKIQISYGAEFFPLREEVLTCVPDSIPAS